MGINEALLDQKLAELEKSRAWSPRLVSKLESLIRSPDEEQLFRINPLQFAKERNISESESIDLFLHASNSGLFQINWELVCPQCGDHINSFSHLQSLDTQFFCQLCSLKSEASMDDFIQVNFTISESIRPIAFHFPEKLSLEDLWAKARFSREGHYPDGARFGESVFRTARGHGYIEPGTSAAFDIELESGGLFAHDLLMNKGFFIPVGDARSAAPQHLSVLYHDGDYVIDQTQLSSGPSIVRVENPSTDRCSLAFFNIANDTVKQPIVFDPFLTGKRLLTSQTFRDLFRNEVIRGTEGITVKDLTILFTDLKGSTDLYERIGDLQAFSLINQHFDSLGKVIAELDGAIVKTMGDAIMAVFMSPTSGLEAGFRMLKAINFFNELHQSRDLILKIGLHRGATIAITSNDRLDYFGQTVNIASRVQSLAEADEIYITKDIHEYPGIPDMLRDKQVYPQDAQLKGIQRKVKVYKIRV
ncbi:MAG: adenylate/guanylate cyclase domain-containing protein [Spirochaetes bacterium]|nr:MAG: adenylate/guanylate cyclase domain-containing protein [Spirochaetota bacterium]